jgi:hypothetical protein
MVDLDRDEAKLDIHHIFPRKWCDARRLSPLVYNSIVNKTAISHKANRMIGGKAPSQYLAQIQNHAQVLLPDDAMDDVLRTHFIDSALLRADNFEEFYPRRKAALLAVVERVFGKALAQTGGPVAEDETEDDENDDEEPA